MNLTLRTLCMLFFLLSAAGCTTTIHVTPDNRILVEEAAQLPSARPVPLSVSVEIKVPVIAAGRKPGRIGEPRDLILDYHAYQLVKDAANVCTKRWFSKAKTSSKQYEITIHASDLVYDQYTDVLAARSVIRVDLSIEAKHDSKIYFNNKYSSGILKGDLRTINTERHVTEQYTRLIYRALLNTIDKAMADLAEQ
jgi:hypothetical protein